MNSFILAIKAFLKAFRDPQEAKKFLEGSNKEQANDQQVEQSHLRLLSLMQNSSRLIDFLKEDLSAFDDSQIGMAVRKIHGDCSKCLEDLVTIRPVMDENEGAKITVPRGYDPLKIKVVGKVKGEPPFEGILVHKGWKAHKRSLPKKSGEQLSEVIQPAEIEVR